MHKRCGLTPNDIALRAKHETEISNPIGRSATSVRANIAERKYGHSRADFIAKLDISLKEASETGKWLEMLLKSAPFFVFIKVKRLCLEE